MYNSDNYVVIIIWKQGLWQYYRDKQALNAVGVIIDFLIIAIVLCLN